MINIFDKNIQELLSDILKQSLDAPVKRKKFRINNKDKIEYIDFLENEEIINTKKINNSHRVYLISYITLYIADCTQSDNIFKNIDGICKVLRSKYEADENDQVSVPVKTILNILNLNIDDFITSFNFLDDYIPMGKTINLTEKDAYICPTERLFNFDKFINVPMGMMKSRYPESFNLEDPNKKLHGNSDINSSKREAVLRAAIAVLAKYPEQCRTKGGNTRGKLVADLLEQKSPLLFPQYDSEPPLSADKISREINKCLKLLN